MKKNLAVLAMLTLCVSTLLPISAFSQQPGDDIIRDLPAKSLNRERNGATHSQ